MWHTEFVPYVFPGGRPSTDSRRKFMLTTNLWKVRWSCASKWRLWYNIPEGGWSSWCAKHRTSVGSSQLGLLTVCWFRMLRIYESLVGGTVNSWEAQNNQEIIRICYMILQFLRLNTQSNLWSKASGGHTEVNILHVGKFAKSDVLIYRCKIPQEHGILASHDT